MNRVDLEQTSSTKAARKESRASTAYVDVAFMLLAVGAFVVLGVQTLNSSTSGDSSIQLFVTDHEATDHFGGQISLIETAPSVQVTRADGIRFMVGDELPGGAVLTAINDTSLMLEATDQDILIMLPEEP